MFFRLASISSSVKPVGGGSVLRTWVPFCSLRLVAHEPVVRRMQPEVFLAGIVVLELLGAGAGREQQTRDRNGRRGRHERRCARLQLCYKTHSLLLPWIVFVLARHDSRSAPLQLRT